MSTTNTTWQLGKYRIIGEVGRGGMATVYKAVDPDLVRPVAIKVLLEGLAADPEFVKRFRNEARMAARLQHPNIVTIHDVGSQAVAGGVKHFMVMEFLGGANLDYVIAQNGPLTLASAAQVVEQVAAALEEARKNDIVHRDVKPANIMVGLDGRVKLTDFGLVRAGEVTGLTHVGQIMGTPEYMAPEQARGEAIDHRTDIYSLGIVLYKMLSGQSPFARSDPLATLYAHVTQELPLDGLLATLPRDVKRVMQKATAKSREQRYQSAAAFSADLLKAAGVQPGRTLVLSHNPARVAPKAASPSSPPSAPKSKPSAPRLFGRAESPKSAPRVAPPAVAPLPPPGQPPIVPPPGHAAEETRLIQGEPGPAVPPAPVRQTPAPQVVAPASVAPAHVASPAAQPETRPRKLALWPLILLALLVVGGGTAALLAFPGGAEPGAAPPSPTVEQTATPAISPTPVVVVVRETVIATEVVVTTQIVVQTATPPPPTVKPDTVTPVPPTETDAPVPTPEPSTTPEPPPATPTRDDAATRTAATRAAASAAATRAAATSIAATRTATGSSGALLPAPALVSPANDAGVSGQTEFRWNWSGTLAPNQAFELRIWKEGQGHWGAVDVTREPRVVFDPSTAFNVGGTAGQYFWSVIVLNVGANPAVPASVESAPFRINIQAGGGPGPSPQASPCPPGGC